MKDWDEESGSLNFNTLRTLYGNGTLKPTDTIKAILGRISRRGEDGVWIFREPKEKLFSRAREVESLANSISSEALFITYPLYGLPFAVKDNIDWGDRPTSAGCSAYTYIPSRTASAVDRLLEAGAILIGKTNLDQFATGLVGIRSPYGVAQNPFDNRYIPGGSSSGSAVAVSAGLVSFSLGTDTAGSGRIPAGFNNIVGLKPTRGIVSTVGTVPACRSLDCISIFSLTVPDASNVLCVMAKEDQLDPFSRPIPSTWMGSKSQSPTIGVRVGVPRKEQLEFFGDSEAETLFSSAIKKVAETGANILEIDYSIFHKVANLLYEGPWVAERYTAIRNFFDTSSEALHPVTREIIEGGQKYSAADVFEANYELEALKKKALKPWSKMDVLLVPTSGTIYKINEVKASPFKLNTNLGYYTNFVNLLDLCCISVPSGFYSNGLPAGVTFIGSPYQEKFLCQLSSEFHEKLGLNLGSTPHKFMSVMS